jgi:hypothetical protein
MPAAGFLFCVVLYVHFSAGPVASLPCDMQSACGTFSGNGARQIHAAGLQLRGARVGDVDFLAPVRGGAPDKDNATTFRSDVAALAAVRRKEKSQIEYISTTGSTYTALWDAEVCAHVCTYLCIP